MKHYKRFELMQELHKVRDFQLVLHADVREPVGEYAVQMLKEAIAVEKLRGRFNDLFPEPLVYFAPRTTLRM